MADAKTCILYVYKGHLGLPSIDYKCLQALFLLRLIPKHNVEIKTSGLYITPYLPMLEYEGQFYTTQANILRKLEEVIGLATKNNVLKGRIEAYKTRTSQSIEPFLALNFWGNDKNCQYLMKMYGSEKYLPFRLIYLQRMNNYLQNNVLRTSRMKPDESNDAINEFETLESYLADISHLLTINKFLLGNGPGVLDAFVCGYLVPIYALNLPDKTLKNILTRYDIVVKYLLSFLKHFNIKIVHDTPAAVQQEPDDNDRASLSLIVTAGVAAFTVMMGYAILNDIIKIK